tara:strand:+ start:187 stop:747 length:561 start_codon:yes stop_codon:yes gene_type:complete
MVEPSDKQRQQGSTRTISSFTPFFKRIRENANSLHGVLKDGWNWHCNDSHKTMLRLERRVEGTDDDFKLLFNLAALAEESRTAEVAKRKGVVVRMSKLGHESGHMALPIPSNASDSAVDFASKSNFTLSQGTASLQSPSRGSTVSEHSDSCAETDRTADKSSVQVKVTGLASRFRSVTYSNNVTTD